MSKKKKRKTSRQTAGGFAAQQPTRTTEFNPDYSTTKSELKRIATLAAIFIAALIVIALFQNQLMSLFMK